MEIKQTVLRLAALAQENRLSIFRLLVEAGPAGMAAGRIAENLGLAPATLSFHLKELAHADLVQPRQEGRFIFYSANFDAMNKLVATLTENCCGVQTGAAVCCPPKKKRKS